ncbi:MAG: hypothetical protein CL917_09770 [Deltaproteobacteria bacterium]|nr:hypothetical protein [Deltaproteobacteria bacterium]
MKSVILSIVILLIVPLSAQSGQMWNALELQVKPGEAAEVIAAIDKFKASDPGKTGESSVRVHRILFAGANPATHIVVGLYGSRADYDKISQAASQTNDFPKLLKSIGKVAKPLSNVSNGTIQGWGTVSNDDKIWTAINLQVKDPMLFMQSMNEMMSSTDTKNFPGQIWLSRVAYGNAGFGGSSNMVVSIGYQSQTEMEKWNDQLYATGAWAKFMKANAENSTVINSVLSEIVKTWDNDLSLEDFKQ